MGVAIHRATVLSGVLSWRLWERLTPFRVQPTTFLASLATFLDSDVTFRDTFATRMRPPGVRSPRDLGSYTILKDWLQPQRESARTVAVRRFETPQYGLTRVQ